MTFVDKLKKARESFSVLIMQINWVILYPEELDEGLALSRNMALQILQSRAMTVASLIQEIIRDTDVEMLQKEEVCL